LSDKFPDIADFAGHRAAGDGRSEYMVASLAATETSLTYSDVGGSRIAGCARCAEWPKELIRARQAANYWKDRHERAVEREAKLKKEIEALQAKVRQRERELFGRKSDGSPNKKGEGAAAATDEGVAADEGATTQGDKPKKKRKRGQQRGAKSHGRRDHDHLPGKIEEQDLPEDKKCCAQCSRPFKPIGLTEASEVIEVEVKAHRRIIKRKSYKSTCTCPGQPKIVIAPPAAKVIPKGTFGTSLWVMILLDKFLLQRPTYRLLTDLRLNYDLDIAQGTVTDGFKRLQPLFKPLYDALIARNVKDVRWHADETRWLVFEQIDGKTGNKWYLWVFMSKTTVVFRLDPSRSAEVPVSHFGEDARGILSVDRYSAYKVLLANGRILLAYCWAHVRRDFLAIAKDWGDAHEAWGLGWVNKISTLYHLNKLRLAVLDKPEELAKAQGKLEAALQKMASDRDAELAELEELPKQAKLADKVFHSARRKALESLKNHWSGLILFLAHPDVPMDNNKAERQQRNPVIGRKNYYGSGARWSGEFAAMLFSIFQTVLLWGLNPRLWLTDYLTACAENGGKAPADITVFLPWNMTEEQKQKYRGGRPPSTGPNANGANTS
jgi:transposase